MGDRGEDRGTAFLSPRNRCNRYLVTVFTARRCTPLKPQNGLNGPPSVEMTAVSGFATAAQSSPAGIDLKQKAELGRV